ncbi:MAG TPA: orotate phosphoribosyltransferase [Actinomycetota bacterium]|nr:orotate phosphoribosyltransferase [Actinomycetota bacterium]
MNQTEILEVLSSTGAVLKGHFRLSSGRHSDYFVQKFRVFEHPRLTQSLGDEIARKFEGTFDVVASPAVGAIVLGFATALAAGVRMVFAEREEGSLAFRRGFTLAPHERTLVVEDVITTGGSAREVVDLVRSSGAVPVGIGALIERVDPARSADLGAPLRALVRLEVESWDEAACPLCSAGHPLDDPGSRRL